MFDVEVAGGLEDLERLELTVDDAADVVLEAMSKEVTPCPAAADWSNEPACMAMPPPAGATRPTQPSQPEPHRSGSPGLTRRIRVRGVCVRATRLAHPVLKALSCGWGGEGGGAHGAARDRLTAPDLPPAHNEPEPTVLKDSDSPSRKCKGRPIRHVTVTAAVIREP